MQSVTKFTLLYGSQCGNIQVLRGKKGKQGRPRNLGLRMYTRLDYGLDSAMREMRMAGVLCQVQYIES